MMKRDTKIQVFLLCLVPFIMVLGNSMLIPVLPKIKKAVDINQFQVGLMVTAFSVPAGIVIPLAGILSDQVGRRKVMAPALIVYGAGGIMAGAASLIFDKPFWGIMAGRIIQGIGAGGTYQLAMAMAGDVFKTQERVLALGLLEASNGLGKVVSPILGAGFALISWFFPFFAYGFLAIPAGFAIGRFEFLSRMFNPLISLLRPVSPLAWLPIGLLVFKGANPAAIWTIFICSIWPMVINTAVGVQRVPSDYMNVAKVLNLSEWKIITKILFPAVLPYMLTGVRLAVGTAWLVIVAAEMLTGGVGVGFWVWDEWNNLNVKNIVIAIFVIGIVGLLLEFALIKLATAFTFEEVKS